MHTIHTIWLAPGDRIDDAIEHYRSLWSYRTEGLILRKGGQIHHIRPAYTPCPTCKRPGTINPADAAEICPECRRAARD